MKLASWVPPAVREEAMHLHGSLPIEFQPAVERLVAALEQHHGEAFSRLAVAGLNERQQADFFHFAIGANIHPQKFNELFQAKRQAKELAVKAKRTAIELADILDQLLALGRVEPELWLVSRLLTATMERREERAHLNRVSVYWPQETARGVPISPPTVAECLRTLATCAKGEKSLMPANIEAAIESRTPVWQYLRNLWYLLDDFWRGAVAPSRALADVMGRAARAVTGFEPPSPENIQRSVLSKRNKAFMY